MLLNSAIFSRQNKIPRKITWNSVGNFRRNSLKILTEFLETWDYYCQQHTFKKWNIEFICKDYFRILWSEICETSVVWNSVISTEFRVLRNSAPQNSVKTRKGIPPELYGIPLRFQTEFLKKEFGRNSAGHRTSD